MAIDIAVFTDLDAVARDAGDMLDRATQPCLFDRLAWYRLIAAHSPPRGEALVIRARDAAGGAWLFLTRDGNRATALANWYSLETGLVTHGRITADLVQSLARHLRERQRMSVIDLAPLSEARLAELEVPFRAAGWWTRASIATVNRSIDVAGTDWQSFLAARPARLRNTILRKSRSSGLRTEVFTNYEDHSWDLYQQVYDASWKPEEGSPAMLRELAREEGQAGTLRLGLAFADDEAVAAQFWLVENGVATIHKLAHVEAKRVQSPGTVLSAAMFRHVIEQDQVGRIDFGTGDDAYKADWMDMARPLHRLRLFNPRSIAGLTGAARESLSVARAAIRRRP